MDPITVIDGAVSVLDRDDVDTDQIIPKQFLKRVERTGFGEFLFYDWKENEGWDLPPNPVRSTRLRNCLGMIWSVSTSSRSSTLTGPSMTVMGSMASGAS